MIAFDIALSYPEFNGIPLAGGAINRFGAAPDVEAAPTSDLTLDGARPR
jgi:hypothetical protein